MARDDSFTTVRSVGGLLPTDLLQRVADTDRDLPGMTPQDYHLAANERIRDAIARAWTRTQGAWQGFQGQRETLPATDRGTTLTRDRWLQVLFQELGYGRVPTTTAIDVDGTDYPVSHRWGEVPIHMVSYKIGLDDKAGGVAGAARWSPHAMVQELLNRSDYHLWALVSNGQRLRILRDNRSLTRQAYVEFDLAAMMDGAVYSDFVLLWLTCHQSRVDADRPELFVLEQWVDTAATDGTRLLDKLRDGVEAALTTLGTGLLAHPDNTALRDAMQAGDLTPQEFYRELLRVVYRLLFLFVAEDRDLLLIPDDRAKPDARDRYLRFYSTQRLRKLARNQAGGPHVDLWRQLLLVFDLVGSDTGQEGLALPPLGGGLWDPTSTATVVGRADLQTSLANHDLLDVLRKLAWTVEDGIARAVDYRNLGAEEFGSIYESLLELHPRVAVGRRQFTLDVGAGNERKTTGSYYTPSSLINQLLDTALDPVLDERVKADDPEVALLDVSVCDPACGSGHFLVAAAHRIAHRLAQVRTGESEPPLDDVQDALRDVVSRCIYGVDVNPMAVELAKLTLWVEAHVPGKPLTFLDHHIRHGNAFMGTTPGLIARGIPNDAFKPIEGDDKTIARSMRDENKKRRAGQLTLAAETAGRYDVLADRAGHLDQLDDDTIEALHHKEREHAQVEDSDELRTARLQADAWCAAFTFPKSKLTNDDREDLPYTLFEDLREGLVAPSASAVDLVADQSSEYGFFHWHVEFPHLFDAHHAPAPDDHLGWDGGFTVMLGNPPWERVKLQQKEFFESRSPEIANATNAAARNRLIKALKEAGDPLYEEYLAAKRHAEAQSHLLRDSGRFPLGGVGDVNTYQVFAELFRDQISGRGRTGFIVPTGIATDYTTRHFFASLVSTKQLATLYDFENRKGLFPEVDSRMKFSLITLAGGDADIEEAEFAFFAHDVSDLRDPDRRFALTPEDIALINPNTKTAPVFRTARDAEICAKIYRNVPVLIREHDDAPDENPWSVDLTTMFHMSNDSNLFLTEQDLLSLGATESRSVFNKGNEIAVPLYEAKFFTHFDHREKDYQQTKPEKLFAGRAYAYEFAHHDDPEKEIWPRYWVWQSEVEKQLEGRSAEVLLGWTDVTSSTNHRTCISCLIPPFAANDKVLLAFPQGGLSHKISLTALWNSFAFDYVTRQKIGGVALKFFTMRQLPVPTPRILENPAAWDSRTTVEEWLVPRSAALSATSYRMAAALGFDHPVRWDADQREAWRAELDAACFHLYSLGRDEVDYVMETFPIVKRKDLAEHGEYRTKHLILEIYDAMAEAIRTGQPYQTRLDPPPPDSSLQVEV